MVERAPRANSVYRVGAWQVSNTWGRGEGG
jgi:hypothetical protein